MSPPDAERAPAGTGTPRIATATKQYDNLNNIAEVAISEVSEVVDTAILGSPEAWERQARQRSARLEARSPVARFFADRERVNARCACGGAA